MAKKHIHVHIHDADPNRIVEVAGPTTDPKGNKHAMRVKTQNGRNYFVLPSETGGVMPKVGAILDPTKHQAKDADPGVPQDVQQEVSKFETAARSKGMKESSIRVHVGAAKDLYKTYGAKNGNADYLQMARRAATRILQDALAKFTKDAKQFVSYREWAQAVQNKYGSKGVTLTGDGPGGRVTAHVKGHMVAQWSGSSRGPEYNREGTGTLDAGNFEESKHPRAASGQFGSGGGSSSAGGKKPAAPGASSRSSKSSPTKSTAEQAGWKVSRPGNAFAERDPEYSHPTKKGKMTIGKNHAGKEQWSYIPPGATAATHTGEGHESLQEFLGGNAAKHRRTNSPTGGTDPEAAKASEAAEKKYLK